MSKDATRQLLLDIGTRLMLETGYAGTGIQAILHEAGVPKGSFYHHFASKEDFAFDIIDAYFADHQRLLDRYLNDGSVSPLTRLRCYFEANIAAYAAQGYRNGCLVGMLSQEMADQSETFRARLRDIFARWRDRFAVCLIQAQAAEEISAHLDVPTIAAFTLDSWEGALLQMKVRKSAEPLHAFVAVLFDVVLTR